MQENIIYIVTHAEDVLFYAASKEAAEQLITEDMQQSQDQDNDRDDYEIEEVTLYGEIRPA